MTDVIYKICLQIIYLIYMHKEDLPLNNLQLSICHKTQPNQTNFMDYSLKNQLLDRQKDL